MTDTSSSRGAPLRIDPVIDALKDLWRDYHWPTKATVALLILSCIVGATLAGWPSIYAGSNPVLRFFASDAFRTLLTLVIGLFIAVNFYIRARRGVLDGDEHYNIARALAFGYFKNFLVPALQLARRERAELQVFQPQSMADLQVYASRIEPRIRARFEHEWLPLVEAPRPDGPPRRTVLAVRRPIGPRAAGQQSQPFFFDAPTALFTVQDFYAALNRRLAEQHKEPIDGKTQLRYQNGQIDSFFRHLDFLLTNDTGHDAVRDLVATMDELSELRMSLRYVRAEELERRYPATSTGGG
jgi:hypothetical protein